ncbi:MAG: response regulator, partial [Planctomycetota bacterium]
MATILLVEDSPTQALEIQMHLESADHRVTHVVDGNQALAALRQNSPDLVVTDLEMPEVNGLELVQAMKTDFAHVPCILVTSHGSEHLAAEALRCGAAGYVPKDQLHELLPERILDVLAVIHTDASYERLIATLQENVFAFDLPNDPALITPLVGLWMQVCSGMELLSSVDMVRLGVAMEHAIANAICHGNLELATEDCPHHGEMAREGKASPAMLTRMRQSPFKERKVHVRATATKSEVTIVVKDHGNGFDTSIAEG